MTFEISFSSRAYKVLPGKPVVAHLVQISKIMIKNAFLIFLFLSKTNVSLGIIVDSGLK